MKAAINLRDLTVCILKDMPENAAVEDLMNAAVFADKVLEGLNNAESDKAISTKNLINEMNNWKKDLENQ